MDCLLHQMLVAMLTVTPVPDAPTAAQMAVSQPRAGVSAPAKAAKSSVALGKRSKTGAQLAQVSVPRAAVVN